MTFELEQLLLPDAKYFGEKVSVYGDTCAISESGWNGTYIRQGRVHIFVKDLDGTWNLQQYLIASDAKAYDYFGEDTVSLYEDTCVVGNGKAYVFTRSEGVWTEQQRIEVAVSGFGCAVSLYEDTCVIGAKLDNSYRGSAYVFTRSGGVWTEQQKLLPNNYSWDWEEFGYAVSIYEDTCIIGCPKYSDSFYMRGIAVIFTRSGGVWTEQQEITPSDINKQDLFGSAVAVYENSCIVGAYYAAMKEGKGAAYIFTRSVGIWTEQQRLGSDIPKQWYGWAVTIYKDMCIVGPREYWVEGGFVDIFTRAGTTWTLQQRISSDGASWSEFGSAVALYEDTLVVGAPFERNEFGVQVGGTYIYYFTPPVPSLINQNPAPGETDISISTDIYFEVVEITNGIELSNVLIYINGNLAYDGATDTFQTNYNGPNSSWVIVVGGYGFTIDPVNNFTPETLVSVRVIVGELDETYMFYVICPVPHLYAQYPAPSQIIYDSSVNISFQILETVCGVDPDNILIYVNNLLAYSGSLLSFQSIFTGPDSLRKILEYGYGFVIDNIEVYSSGNILVRVIVANVGGSSQMDETWSFYLSNLPSPEAVEKKDLVIIEDSADGFKKKKLQLSRTFIKTEEQEKKGIFYAHEVLESTTENSFELSNIPELNSYVPYSRTIQVFKNGGLIKYDETLPDIISWKYNSTTNTVHFNDDYGSKYQFIYWTDGSTFWSDKQGDFPPYIFEKNENYNQYLSDWIQYDFPSSISTNYRSLVIGGSKIVNENPFNFDSNYSSKVNVYFYRDYIGWGPGRPESAGKGYEDAMPFQIIIPPDEEYENGFGKCVCVYGNTLAIGSPDKNSKGVVYVYYKDVNEQENLYNVDKDANWIDWEFVQKIEPENNSVDFGSSITINENFMAIGSLYPGEVYLYKRNGNVWEKEDIITNNLSTSSFGYSVKLRNTSLIVGAPTESEIGAAYVYVYTVGNWYLQKKITSSDGVVGDNFGMSVSIYDDKCIIGAPFANVGDIVDAGAIYIYTRTAGVWGSEFKLDPEIISADNVDLGGHQVYYGKYGFSGRFGNSVEMDDDIIIITSPQSGQLLNVDFSLIWIFRFINNEWKYSSSITNSGWSVNDGNQGYFIGLSNNTLAYSIKIYKTFNAGTVATKKLSGL